MAGHNAMKTAAGAGVPHGEASGAALGSEVPVGNVTSVTAPTGAPASKAKVRAVGVRKPAPFETKASEGVVPPHSEAPAAKPQRAGQIDRLQGRDSARLVDPRTPPDYAFTDGYNLRRQYRLCEHLVNAVEPDPLDAQYHVYTEYLRRVNVLNSELSRLAATRYANPEAPDVVVARLGRLGALVADEDEGEESIEIHTETGLRLFTGVTPGMQADGSRPYQVDGATRAGNAMRGIVAAAKAANPYAEAVLVQIEAMMALVSAETSVVHDKYQKQLMDAAKRGVRVNVVRNASPVEQRIVFKTPYGYKLAYMVSTADYCFRLVRTGQSRGFVSAKEAETDLATVVTHHRRLFAEVTRFAQVFTDANVFAINRGDWVTHHLTRSTPKAKQSDNKLSGVVGSQDDALGSLSSQPSVSDRRIQEQMALRMRAVQGAEKRLGRLPEAILLGDVQPEFLGSHARVSVEERKLISQVVAARRLE